MKKIIECVPNFSEGRDKKKIDLIVREIGKIKGVSVLDIDMDASYNRTVITFAGEAGPVESAAFKAIAKAAELIDMPSHKGEHPRIGACDVCPFVPIKNATMAECVEISRNLGQRVGQELGIPVFLYEEAATIPERKNLAEIRKGEYEGLEKKLADADWLPDYGEAVFNKKSGATVIGAREPLIAFNVYLGAESKRAADIISGHIRESGRTIISRDGKRVRFPGVFKAVRAMGVSLEEYGIYQVSTNLINYKVTPPHEVFEMVKRLSPGLAEVFGSEIVGLAPKEALLMAGRFYSSEEKSEEKLIRAAIENLGLNSIKDFNPGKKIIEYSLAGSNKMLKRKTVKGFLEELSSGKPAPGGGSAAALSGAAAAGLVAMAAKLSKQKEIAEKSEKLMKLLMDLIDKDAEAFKWGDLKEATEIPLQTARYSYEVLKLAEVLLESCNPKVLSDVGVAAKMAESAVEGALLNVRVNLISIKDQDYEKEILQAVKEFYLTGYLARMLLSKIQTCLH